MALMKCFVFSQEEVLAGDSAEAEVPTDSQDGAEANQVGVVTHPKDILNNIA